jgi:leucine-zipper of insertion element IS481
MVDISQGWGVGDRTALTPSPRASLREVPTDLQDAADAQPTSIGSNAALSLNRRRLLCERVVDEAWTVTKAAEAAEVSVRCARKWVGRYRAEGETGLFDRSSAPHRIPHRTSEERVHVVEELSARAARAPDNLSYVNL